MSELLPFFHLKMRIKEGKEEEFKQLSKQMTHITQKEDEGCIQY